MPVKSKRILTMALSLLAAPAIVWAGELVLPFTFSPGTPIRSSEMNANFAATKQAIDALDTQISSAGSGLFRSGSRLKAVTLESSDGASVPLLYSTAYGGYPLFWDSQLNVFCAAYPTTSALSGKCAPVGASTGYADSTCNTRVLIVDTAFYRSDLGVGPNGPAALIGFEIANDGGVLLYSGQRQNAAVAQTYYKSSYGTTTVDGGTEIVTTCNTNGTQAPIAQISVTVPLSDLASVSLTIH